MNFDARAFVRHVINDVAEESAEKCKSCNRHITAATQHTDPDTANKLRPKRQKSMLKMRGRRHSQLRRSHLPRMVNDYAIHSSFLCCQFITLDFRRGSVVCSVRVVTGE